MQLKLVHAMEFHIVVGTLELFLHLLFSYQVFDLTFRLGVFMKTTLLTGFSLIQRQKKKDSAFPADTKTVPGYK